MQIALLFDQPVRQSVKAEQAARRPHRAQRLPPAKTLRPPQHFIDGHPQAVSRADDSARTGAGHIIDGDARLHQYRKHPNVRDAAQNPAPQRQANPPAIPGIQIYLH